MKGIKNWTWFTPGQTDGTFTQVGVVEMDLTIVPEFDHRFYIGMVRGFDEQADVECIALWGAHFPDAAGDALFRNVPDRDQEEWEE